jgi:hypothetical protein
MPKQLSAKTVASAATIEPDIYEVLGDWIKRQVRHQWRIERQAYNARVRATRADRDEDKLYGINFTPMEVREWLAAPRHLLCYPPRRADSANGEDSSHGR